MQSLFITALFEYVRRHLPGGEKGGVVLATDLYDDTELKERVSELEKIKRAIIDDYQRMCGMEIRYDEAHAKLSTKLELLANVPEKVEAVRVSSEITAKAIEELFIKVANRHERVQASFHALEVREQLPVIEAEIMQHADRLIERLRSGEAYNRKKWDEWELIHADWRQKLDEWFEIGTWYGLAVKERVNTFDDKKYATPLVIPDISFPDAEAVRRFKKFLIIYDQWQEIVPEVKRGVDQVAFAGLTEREVRNGRPPG